jgi:hypothetical protein
MSSFYSNLAQEDTYQKRRRRRRRRKRERVKNAIVLKKKPKNAQKRPKKPNFKKAVIAGG